MKAFATEAAGQVIFFLYVSFCSGKEIKILGLLDNNSGRNVEGMRGVKTIASFEVKNIFVK